MATKQQTSRRSGSSRRTGKKEEETKNETQNTTNTNDENEPRTFANGESFSSETLNVKGMFLASGGLYSQVPFEMSLPDLSNWISSLENDQGSRRKRVSRAEDKDTR